MSDTLINALKPCPFCGGTAKNPEKSGGDDERNGYNFTMAIKCQDCGAFMSRKSREDKGGWCNDTGQAKCEVIAAWNRRAANTAPSQQQAEDADYVRVPKGVDGSMYSRSRKTVTLSFRTHEQAEAVHDAARKAIIAAAQPPQVGNGELRKEGV